MARLLVWLLMSNEFVISCIRANHLLNQSNIEPNFGWNPVNFLLNSHSMEDLVQCLETMWLNNRNEHVNFVFVGDSRIRQQFYSFVQLLPDYDFRWRGAIPDRRMPVHVDMAVESDLLGVRVSFYWRPFIDHDLFDQFIEWTEPHRQPMVLLLGISVWYMLPDKGTDKRTFTRRLELLEPKIRILARSTRIIWLHQAPIVEMFGNLKSDNTAIYTGKIDRYNQQARHILKNSGAVIWDSGQRLAEEYVRSCVLNRRRDPHKYVDCYDYIHTGYVALNRGTRFLVHTICEFA